MWGTAWIVLYVLAIVTPMAVAAATTTPLESFPLDLGRNLGIAAFAILALQPVLSARYAWVSRPFGFDTLIRFHRNMAILALGLLLIHPFLTILGRDNLSLFWSGPASVWLGKIALVLLIVTGLTSLFRERFRLTFERWRLAHDGLAVSILVLGFLHSWLFGQNLDETSMQVLWIAFLGVGAGSFTYHRFLRPWWLGRRPYEVTEVVQEAENVWTVKMSPPDGGGFDYLPGQFQFITFRRGRGLPTEEHHWTISSSPTEPDIVSSTIKALGDFTSTMGETRPGDEAVIRAPFGRFSHTLHPDEEQVVFVAGGIGITPVRSMLRYMADTGETRPVTLFYGVQSPDSAVFWDEIREIEESGTPPLTFVPVVEDPDDDWDGETGFVDRDILDRHQSETPNTGYYVVGPKPLLDSTMENLSDMGVESRRVHSEIFALLG